jgi:calcineurin-like phosphoesterase family protein
MSIWFTADLHLGHSNIIKYCDRPFKDRLEMDVILIKNWNETVQPDDDIYVLGDICFYRGKEAKAVISRLLGNIYLIAGNHDRERELETVCDRFVWVRDYHEMAHNGQFIVMSHYPFLSWRNSHKGAWSLHGHCHGSLPDDPTAKRLDVGVDCHDFRPISFDEVNDIMKKKTFTPIDHHRK